MHTLRRPAALASIGVLFSIATPVRATPLLRHQVNQTGDFVLFGNTLAYECATGITPPVPAPVVGTATCTGVTNVADSSPDIFWQSNDGTNSAIANGTITAEQAGSTAVLNLPQGAVVTYARLYWAGYLAPGGTPDTEVRMHRGNSYDTHPIADAQWTAADQDYPGYAWYQATADVTNMVSLAKAGPYRVTGVNTVPLPSIDNDHGLASWSVVVFYQLDSEPARNLTLFDGLDLIGRSGSQEVRIQGFKVPEAFGSAKLGVVAYEGDARYTGDELRFKSVVLSDALNPADDFFNATRSLLGTAVSNTGDLPQLNGQPNSMAGVDMDVVDITTLIEPYDTWALVQASSGGDGEAFLLAAFVTSIPTLQPDFSASTKTVSDLTPAPIYAGDQLEYTITAINSGSDNSTNTAVTDILPTEVTYVPGSISIDGVAQTDQAGDDQAEFVQSSHSVMVRLGAGATATQGGKVNAARSTKFTYRVTVNSGVEQRTVYNQGLITAQGEQGSSAKEYKTDGNGAAPGAPPTEAYVSAPGDSDGDGLKDPAEVLIGTNPLDADTDDDGVLDGAEPNPTADADADGLINALDPDSDNDGLPDGTEMGKNCSHAHTDLTKGLCVPDGDAGFTVTNPQAVDTDGGGVADGVEDKDRDGVVDDGETNPAMGFGEDDDSDWDGLPDNTEVLVGTNKLDADSDDDGLLDGLEPTPGLDSDKDGLINALDPDSDNDGLFDGTEMGRDCSHPHTDLTKNQCVADADAGLTTTNPLLPDTDAGGVADRIEDKNGNGRVDDGETNPSPGHGGDDDADSDGLSNKDEGTIGTNPFDADSDDDGVLDGAEPKPATDSDGDGLINALDPDSDNDGLFDGTEMGKICSNKDTDLTKAVCVADGDNGFVTTDPLLADTDGGGELDSSEDKDHDGVVDDGETNPAVGNGDDDDGDGDGLPNKDEGTIGTDPKDADSDDDGLLDGAEPNPGDDADGDGRINALDPDSDDDGLFDGTELGKDCSNEDTDLTKGWCVPDGDQGLTVTNPLVPDTDGGRVEDGVEDIDHDGVVDNGETNPAAGHGNDDDSDWDGLPNFTEDTIGTNPLDRDSDDDGLLDGAEPAPGEDAEGDGAINALDPDSDNDGLFDGTELGKDCTDPDTNLTLGQCVPDADQGATVTNPRVVDTDKGSVSDGIEDENRDGRIDPGERDPNDPRDDIRAAPAAPLPVGRLEGSGCDCSVPRSNSRGFAAFALALGGLLLRRVRRRR